jgi:hypothetical protein
MLPERFAARFPELVERPAPTATVMVDVWRVRARALRDLPGVEVVATWLTGLIEGMRVGQGA